MDICIYHSRDLDGWSSAAIIRRRWPSVKLIGWDYGMEMPEIPDGKLVVMVDISFSDTELEEPFQPMIDLANRSEKLVWIDHHKSALDYYEAAKDKFPETCLQIGNSSKAACEHTWEAVFGSKQKMPLVIKWLGLYDTFRKDEAGEDWEKAVLPFQYGMQTYVTSPETFPYELMDEKSSPGQLAQYIGAGQVILKNMDNFHKAIANSAQVFKLEGYTCVALNTLKKGSISFDHTFNPEEHDFMMAYSRSKDHWNISFYCDSDKVDCSAIAKKFGGGGHAGAAGCTMDDETLIGIINGK